MFARRCLGCHNDETRTSGLTLTSRDSILKGGTRGPAATPGHPEQSLMVEAIGYDGGLKMPPTAKLASSSRRLGSVSIASIHSARNFAPYP